MGASEFPVHSGHVDVLAVGGDSARAALLSEKQINVSRDLSYPVLFLLLSLVDVLERGEMRRVLNHLDKVLLARGAHNVVVL